MATTTSTAKALPVAIPSGEAIVLGRSKAHGLVRQAIADYRAARAAADAQKTLGAFIKDAMLGSDAVRIEDGKGVSLAWITAKTKAVVDVDAMREACPEIVAAYEGAKAAYDALAEDYTTREFDHYAVGVAR